tara:strand:- start:241 stop:735 length:495 start_codon:yes stop_codon:yes gene_type:complete
MYNPYVEKNQALELFTQQKMQGNLAAKADMFLKSPAYNAAATDEDKQARLTTFLKGQINYARQDAKETLERMSSIPEVKGDYEAYVRGEFRAMSRTQIRDAELAWSQISVNYGYEGMSINEVFDAVDGNPDIKKTEKEVYKTNLRNLYIGLGKDYSKFLKDLTD